MQHNHKTHLNIQIQSQINHKAKPPPHTISKNSLPSLSLQKFTIK
jgi:hypothetical protein